MLPNKDSRIRNKTSKIRNKTHENKHNISTLAANPTAQQDLIQDLLAHRDSFYESYKALVRDWQLFTNDLSTPNFFDELHKDPKKHEDYIARIDAAHSSFYKDLEEIEENWAKLRNFLGSTDKGNLPYEYKQSSKLY